MSGLFSICIRVIKNLIKISKVKNSLHKSMIKNKGKKVQ